VTVRVTTCGQCPMFRAGHNLVPFCVHPTIAVGEYGMRGRRTSDPDRAPPKWCPLRLEPLTAELGDGAQSGGPATKQSGDAEVT